MMKKAIPDVLCDLIMMGVINLQQIGIILIFIGISYLIYSIMFRNKVTFYFKKLKIVKEKEEKYLNLQLYFAVINSLITSVIGIATVLYNLNTPYILLTPLIFHLINYAMKLTSKRK